MRDNFNKESTNVLIIGKSGVGKSSLVNYLFGKELQPVGVGAPVTKMQIKEFTYKYDKHFEMHIYDTWGLEPSTQKAELWKKKIFDEIARHDKKSISEWFNTIIFCLNAKSSRIEDFELDIMEQLLREKNHLTIALTHCRSKEDPDGIILRKSIREELEKRGVDSLEDRNFVFVSNVNGDKITFVCAASKAAIEKGLKAGDLVKAAAQLCGGNGGGRPDMAQAGGKDITSADKALEEVRSRITNA